MERREDVRKLRGRDVEYDENYGVKEERKETERGREDENGWNMVGREICRLADERRRWKKREDNHGNDGED